MKLGAVSGFDADHDAFVTADVVKGRVRQHIIANTTGSWRDHAAILGEARRDFRLLSCTTQALTTELDAARSPRGPASCGSEICPDRSK
jgi:hypothetical protein